MVDCPDTRRWVEKAEEDARAARALTGLDLHAFSGTITFHCQQSGEKYLKACLINRKLAFPKTHDFGQLITLCLQVSTDFEPLRSPTDRLQPYAVLARYPYLAPQESEVKRALEDMEQVRTFCRGFLEIAER